MIIQVAVLCDAATDYNGKLNVLGTFDTLFTSQLPAVHPQCSVALRIAFERPDEGSHKLKMNFVNEDGKMIMPTMEAPLDISLPDEGTFISRNFIINIQQLKLETAGLYSIEVGVDDRELISIPLCVKQVEQQQPGR